MVLEKLLVEKYDVMQQKWKFVKIALKTNPVEKAENTPNAMPNLGTKISNASRFLDMTLNL